MSEQTVSLKLDADASGLKSEVQASGQAMEDLAGQGTQAGEQIEASVNGASSAWEDHSGVINAAAASMGAIGAALEGFARSQQDATVELARTSTVTGIQSDALRDLAADTANVTFATEDVIGTFHTLGRQGIDTEGDLQRVANVWDMVADATGENVVQLAESSVALRTLGIDAREPEQALDALGFITQQTTGSVGDFLTFIERTGPELNELGMDINDTAALMAILETEMGMTGRVARTEFRQAVNEANGDMSVMLDILGVTPESFDAMRGSVEGSSQALEDNAQAFADSFTPLQRLASAADEAMLKYGGLGEAAGMLSPVLMGAGGVVFGINQARTAMQNMNVSAGTLGRTLGRGGLVVGSVIVAREAVGALAGALQDAPTAVEDFILALEGIAVRGQVPDAVADSLDDVRGALDQLVDPSAVQRFDDWLNKVTFAPFESNMGQARDEIENFDSALAGLVSSGNDAAVAAALEILAGVADDLGVELDELIREHFPEYERAAEAAALASEQTEEAVSDAGDAFEETAVQTLTAAEAIDEYIDANRRATDPVFRLMDAIEQVDSAQQDYNDAVEEYGEQSDEAADASINLMRRLGDLEAAAIDGDVSFEEFEGQLSRWVVEGRITETQAGLIRDRVAEASAQADRFEGTRMMVLNASGNAWNRLSLLGTMFANLPRDTVLFVNSGVQEWQARADGGPVDRGQPYLVGEEGPELVTFGQPGFVHDAATTAQMFNTSAGSAVTTTGAPLIGEMNVYGDDPRHAAGEVTHRLRMHQIAGVYG